MTLSEYFRCIVLDAPDRIISASVQNNPDVIVVDETVNGVYGEELCSKVKADKAIANIPVILLIKSADNESICRMWGVKPTGWNCGVRIFGNSGRTLLCL